MTRFTIHSVAAVVAEPPAGDSTTIAVDTDALRAEFDNAVQAAYALGTQHRGPGAAADEEEEDALLMLVEEETATVAAAAPSDSAQVEQLEAEVRRLQQLCDAQEGELTDRKVAEAESSRRLEEACKMLETYEAALQAQEDAKVTAQAERDSLIGDLNAKTASLHAKEAELVTKAMQLRAFGESLSQAQHSAQRLQLELQEALAAAVEADKHRGLAQERAAKDRTVWDAVLFALGGRPAQTRSQKLFKIAFSCMLLSQALLESRHLANPVSQDAQVEHLATRVLEVKNQISRHQPPFSTSQPASASASSQEALRGRIRRD